MSDEVYRGILDAYSWAASAAQNEALAVSAEMTRPSVLFRPRVFRDRTKFCALYGDDLAVGVAGFGDSPEEAARDFDAAWTKKIDARDARGSGAK